MSIEVGSRLKEIRRKLKMTREQLGEKPGINGNDPANSPLERGGPSMRWQGGDGVCQKGT